MPGSRSFARLPSYALSLCLFLFVYLQKVALASSVPRVSTERSVHSVKKNSVIATTGNEVNSSGGLDSARNANASTFSGSLSQTFHLRSERKKREGWRARDAVRAVSISSSSSVMPEATARYPQNNTTGPQREAQNLSRETVPADSNTFLNTTVVGIHESLSEKAVSPTWSAGVTPSLRACSRVPYTVEKTCRRLVYSQRAYSCASEFHPTSCKDRSRAFVFDCWQKKTRNVSYACPKMQTKTLCYKVPRIVAETCKRIVSRWKRKECTRQIQELQCHLQTVDHPGTCVSSESYTEHYECEKFQTRLDCRVSFEVQKEACSREVDVPITYEYDETDTENVCEKKKRTLHKKCFRDVIVEEYQPCEQTVHEPRCEKLPQRQQKMCSGKKIRAETYPCQEVKMQRVTTLCSRAVPPHKKRRSSCRSSQETDCKAGEDKSKTGAVTLETYPCERDIPVAVPSFCTREVGYDAEYPCEEMVLEEHCSMEERRIETTCPKLVVKKEEYDCEEVQEVEECHELPRKTRKTAVLRVDKRVENFTCEKPVSAESCVEVPEIVSAVCSAELVRASEKPCIKERKEEKCEVVEKTVPGICGAEEQEEEEYICPKVEFTEDWVLGECSEEVEDEVKASCTEEVLEEECSREGTPQEKTCFEDVEEEEEYACYDVQYREECQDYVG